MLIFLEATKFVLLSIFTLTETNCHNIWKKLLPSDEKWPVPVDVPGSKRPCKGEGASTLYKLCNLNGYVLLGFFI